MGLYGPIFFSKTIYYARYRGMSDKLVKNVLDLNQKDKPLQESFLRMFGSMIQALMQRMFGMPSPEITIRGTQEQIDALEQGKN